MTTSTRITDLIDTADEDEIAALEVALRQIRSAKSPLDATWESAVEEFLANKYATLAPKTLHYYRTQLTVLVRWCEEQGVTLHKFCPSHLNKYLVWRKTNGGRHGKLVAAGTGQ